MLESMVEPNDSERASLKRVTSKEAIKEVAAKMAMLNSGHGLDEEEA